MGAGVITIRRLGPEDLAEVAALEQANQPQPWSKEVLAGEAAAKSRIYLVARDEEGVVGFGGVMVVGEEAHVTNLLVAPDRRRQGIGRHLMSELIAGAVEAGALHLTLEVRARNHAARALYARLGLAPVGIRPRYYGDEDALIMWAHDIHTRFPEDDPA